jgi:hypothetical protein
MPRRVGTMRLRYLLLMVLVLALSVSMAWQVSADTIHFRNKTVLDGVKIVAEDWRSVKAEISDGVIVSFARKDIVRVERERLPLSADQQVTATSTELLALVAAGKLPLRIAGRSRIAPRALEVSTATPKDDEANPLPRLIAAVRVQKRGDTLNFNLDVRDTMGARYALGRFKVDGKQPPPPGFEVRDANGTLVLRGRFKYG